ncbi:SDA1-like [Cyclospora cayetanensis]|uniref:Protein SDA1 n=1 Tax=Cyclospora cayetanensis TaxID=88456 RepID=A0A1D3CWF6_9EIME|nr:SDA1-like [Cyclospora cayetanensis]
MLQCYVFWLLLQQRLQKRLVRKQQRIEEQREQWGTTASTAILDLIYDPHSFAEKLFARVRQQRESFGTRVVFLNLLSRLISHHKVLLFNLYPYLQRYMNPTQRLVPALLAVSANAVHAGVPPQEVLPLVKTIADNFVNDTRGEEVITLGLNAIMEICSRNPQCMTAELLGDLLQYTKHKSSKSVSAAARGLLNVFREVCPTMLPKAFLGKEAAIQLQRNTGGPLEFGALTTSTTLSLLPQLEALKRRSKEELQRALRAEDSQPDEDAHGEEIDKEKIEIEQQSTQEATEGGQPPKKKRRLQTAAGDAATKEEISEVQAEADHVPEGGARLLTDADFAALRLLRAKHLAQQVRGGSRKKGGLQVDSERDLKLLKLLTAEEDMDSQAANSSDSSSDSEDSEDETEGHRQEDGFVSERDLEGIAGRKRRRARERAREREEKLQQKKLGGKKWQQDTENKKGSTPQHVKDRRKPLLMIQQSRRLREKKQLSVRDKAANLKKRIKNLKKSQVGKPRRRKR